MRRFLSVFIFLLAFFIFAITNISAQSGPGEADDNLQKELPAYASVNPPIVPADQKTVEIKFQEIPRGIPRDQIFVCFRTNLCIRDIETWNRFLSAPIRWQESFKESIGIGNAEMDTGAFRKNPLSELEGANNNNQTSGEATLIVCGDGATGLKTVGCTSNDYFHPGHEYAVTLYVSQGNGNYVSIGNARFYVKHHKITAIPKITTYPQTNINPEDSNASKAGTHSIWVDIETKILGSAGRAGDEQRNNYVVEIEKDRYQERDCVAFAGFTPGSVQTKSTNPFPKDDTILTPGTYIIKVNELVNDQVIKSGDEHCESGYTFARLICNLVEDENGEGRFDINGDEPGGEDKCREIIDPNNIDAPQLERASNPCRTMNSVFNGSDYKTSVQGYQDLTRCTSFRTAIGDIGTYPSNFLISIFSIVLYIAGLGAVSIILYSGYRLMTSRGNKETIQDARERLTAAIFGIIFIILSFVILQVIGAEILRIPGFG